MKRVSSIIAVLAMLLVCAGCGAGSVEDTQTTTTESTVATDGTTDTSVATTAGTTQTQPTNGTSVRTTTTTTTTTKTTKTTAFRMRYYPQYTDHINVRGALTNTGYRITQDKELRIAFMGGSVTNGMGSTSGTSGFRGRLLTNARLTYEAAFYAVDASLGGNGSQYGVYIADTFVAAEKPDLVFIEYAVNNAYDGVTDADTLWNHYESMIYTIREANPYADIVLLYVSDEANRSKSIIPVLEEIAEKYDLASVNLYAAINEAMQSNGYTWGRYYSDSVHMSDNGYDLSAELLQGVLEYAISTKTTTYQKITMPTPKTTIQSEATAVLTSKLTTVPAGWEKVSEFSYAGTKYGGCIETSTANKPITVKFKGTDFGVLVEFAEDAGVLEYSIDGGTYQRLNCSLDYSNPKARLLLKNGTNGEHTITMRLSGTGRMAIAAFLLNGTVQSVQ